MKKIILVTGLLLNLSSPVGAQQPSESQLQAVLEQLNKEEILEAAKKQSKSIVLTCPPGMARGKKEDLAEFIVRHRNLQERVSAELETFRQGKVNKDAAIDLFNKSVDDYNQVIRWGKGKASDVCFPKSLLETSGKTTDATKVLIESFRKALSN